MRADFGFNPAWWIAISLALFGIGAGFLMTQPPHPYIAWPFFVGACCALIAGVISLVESRGWILQSPIVLSSNKLPVGSLPARPMLLASAFIAEVLVVGMIVGTIITQRRISSSVSPPISDYQKQRDDKRRAERVIPPPFSDSDTTLLITQLTPADYVPAGQYKFQIIREDDDICRHFADSLSDLLKKSKWGEVAPVSSPSPGFAMPLGITIKTGTLAPAFETGYKLEGVFKAFGIYSNDEGIPELRHYDYALIYISDKGYLPAE